MEAIKIVIMLSFRVSGKKRERKKWIFKILLHISEKKWKTCVDDVKIKG